MPETFEDLPLQRSCGAAAMYYRQLEVDPTFGENQRSLESVSYTHLTLPTT